MFPEKSPFDQVADTRQANGFGGRWYGVFQALVTDIKDPDGQGRVRIKLPWSPDGGGDGYDVWARLATLMGGNNRGSWFIPDVDDEVLVAFEAGDPRRPYVVGGLWNGRDTPPETMDGAGNNYKKVLRSRNGVKVTLDDQDGQENFIVETPGGQKITLKDGPAEIKIEDSNGNFIEMKMDGITINAAMKVTINAPAGMKITAPMVEVDSAMSRFSGVVNVSGSVITPSVIAQTYTPGAGNIW
jgi:uncharacterized protein involved in type VI secretion and phage assembly